MMVYSEIYYLLVDIYCAQFCNVVWFVQKYKSFQLQGLFFVCLRCSSQMLSYDALCAGVVSIHGLKYVQNGGFSHYQSCLLCTEYHHMCKSMVIVHMMCLNMTIICTITYIICTITYVICK